MNKLARKRPCSDRLLQAVAVRAPFLETRFAAAIRKPAAALPIAIERYTFTQIEIQTRDRDGDRDRDRERDSDSHSDSNIDSLVIWIEMATAIVIAIAREIPLAMNVTKSNFLQVATEIEALLPSVEFVAIDEEMTGISMPGLQEFVGDAPNARYAKMRQVASNYNVIQFGVALFTRPGPGDDTKLVGRAYNFYVFPETGPVNMDASSVHFNSKNGMDWNAWIREGIPYLTREAAAKLKLQLFPDDGAPTASKRIQLTNPADIETTSNAVASLKVWLADENRMSEKEFEVITTNAYLRRFMHETLRENFPDLVVESRPTKTRGLSTMVALRLSTEEKSERDTKLRAEKEAEFGMKVGVRRVFDALAASKKPIIGHACLYDLMFAFSHFEGRLPEAFADFKKAVCGLFPTVYDTQLLAKSDLFRLRKGAEEGLEGSVLANIETSCHSAQSISKW